MLAELPLVHSSTFEQIVRLIVMTDHVLASRHRFLRDSEVVARSMFAFKSSASDGTRPVAGFLSEDDCLV